MMMVDVLPEGKLKFKFMTADSWIGFSDGGLKIDCVCWRRYLKGDLQLK